MLMIIVCPKCGNRHFTENDRMSASEMYKCPMIGCGNIFRPFGIRIIQYMHDLTEEYSMESASLLKYFRNRSALKSRLNIGPNQRYLCYINGRPYDGQNPHLIINQLAPTRQALDSVDMQVWICSNTIRHKSIRCSNNETTYDVDIHYMVDDLEAIAKYDQRILFSDIEERDGTAVAELTENSSFITDTLSSIVTNASKRINNNGNVTQMEKELYSIISAGFGTYGFKVTGLQIHCMQSLTCSICGAPIYYQGANTCPKGHRQYWCPNPACQRHIASPSGMYQCPDCGQELLMCDMCGKLVLVERNRFCNICGKACYPPR